MNLKDIAVVLAGVCMVGSGLAQVAGQSGGGFQPEPAQGAAGNAYDPMSFYRQNPELMKRYFPHLAQGTNPPASRYSQPREATINLRFPGGNPGELIAELNLAYSQQIGDGAPNILVGPQVREMEIPPFELNNVTLADIFEALNNLAGPGDPKWELSGSKTPIWVLNSKQVAIEPIDPLTGQPIPGGARNPSPQVIRNKGVGFDWMIGQPLGQQEPHRITSVYPVGKYLEDYRIEDLTTAIQTAWEMMPGATPADLKYHKDTRLLIAVGSAEQQDLIRQILESLESQPKRPEAGGGPAAKKGENEKLW